MMKRTLVIGDVHGCLHELQDLLLKLGYTPGEDRLVFLGDLIDKGPDPVGVVRLTRLLKAECILGNHEESALRWRRHEARCRKDPKYKNPMREISDELREQWSDLSEEDDAWLRSLPLTLDLGNDIVVVHAGFLPGLSIAEQPADKILRLRWVDAAGKMVPLQEETMAAPEGAREWMGAWDGNHHVIYGHAVHSLEVPKLVTTAHAYETIGIDTGCVFGGHLTALILDKDFTRLDIAQVKARRAYREVPPGTFNP